MAADEFVPAVEFGSATSTAELGMLLIQDKRFDEAAKLFNIAEKKVGTSHYWNKQLSPAASSTCVLNCRFLSAMACSDVASNICQALAQHVIDPRFEPSFHEVYRML